MDDSTCEGKFLAKFGNVDAGYNLEKLMLLGILLSQGGPAEKAFYLTRHIDPALTGSFYSSDFMRVYLAIEDIATVAIPLLVKESLAFSQTYKDRVSSYLYQLQKIK
jgi:hypothetical protein